ncbi:MAG: hypothetical protein CMM58_12645 [Rhodospirillaceae bacterium]|nr:hypothetical protein [Rhodospirillaceae bacterium]
MGKKKYRIGIDVGGTFTDIVLINNETGELSVTKVLNRHSSRDETVLEGIKRLLTQSSVSFKDIEYIAHGTTITTNTVIERKGAKTALITNQNFRDILEIGRFARPAELIYRVHEDKPSPLVPRYLRYGVPCRIDRDGKVFTPLDVKKLSEIIESLISESVESVAVCFLFSFLNPSQEHEVRDHLSRSLPHVEVVLSSEILREFREFPRTSTTVFAAYVAPVLRSYISGLVERLAGHKIKCPLYIFQSNGGVANPDVVMQNPALTLLSGPAGAVVGASQLCGQAGYNNLITMDVGGTSLDVCLIQNSDAEITTTREIDMFPISTPTIDVHTIGAGGGSIIRIDEVGRITVGPDSMGADPGPVCYGLGGTLPTLTDINLLMGLIDPNTFANGEVFLDKIQAANIVQKAVAARLCVDLETAISGVYNVATNQIAEAIRAVTIENGSDPRSYSLVAFGGGGPLHAAAVAQELGIARIIIPKHPGLFSARGIGTADFNHDYIRSIVRPFLEISSERILDVFSELEESARRDLDVEKIDPINRRLVNSFDLRYVGQTTEINVPLIWSEKCRDFKKKVVVDQFHKIHLDRYSYNVEDEPVELVNIRLRAVGLIDKPPIQVNCIENIEVTPNKERQVLLPGSKVRQTIPVYKRNSLNIEGKLIGPAIIEEESSTTLVLQGMEITVDQFENIVIQSNSLEDML